MRKRNFTKNVGVMLTDEQYDQLVYVTDALEITLSEYIRDLIEKEARKNHKEEYQDE